MVNHSVDMHIIGKVFDMERGVVLNSSNEPRFWKPRTSDFRHGD